MARRWVLGQGWIDDGAPAVGSAIETHLSLRPDTEVAPLTVGRMMPAEAEEWTRAEAERIAEENRQRAARRFERDWEAGRERAREARAARMAGLTPAQRTRAIAAERDIGDDTLSLGDLSLGLLADVVPHVAGGALGLIDDEAGDRLEYGLRGLGTRAYNLFGSVPGVAALGEHVEYSPNTLASEAIPFSDEIVGGVDAFANDRTLDEALDEAHQRRADLRERNRGSALLGLGGQGLVLGPLLAPAAASGAVSPSAWGAIRSGALTGAREGAIFGGMQGLDESRGSLAADLGKIASQRTEIPAGLRQVGETALEDLRGLGTGAGLGLALGSGLGGAFGALGHGARRALTGLTPEGEAAVARSNLEEAIAGHPSLDVDTTLEDLRTGEQLGAADPLSQPIVEYRPDAASLVEERPLALRDIATDAFRVDPDIARLRAAGLTDRRQLRAAQNLFGIGGLSRRLDAYGLLREGEIAANDVVFRRAQAAQQQAADIIHQTRARAEAAGFRVDAGELADQIDALADEYRRTPTSASQDVAAMLDRESATMRANQTNSILVPRRPTADTVRDPGAPRFASPTIPERRTLREPFRAPPTARQARGPNGTIDDYEPIIPDPEEFAGDVSEPTLRGSSLQTPPDPEEFDLVPLMDWEQMQRARDSWRLRNRDFLTGSGTTAPGLSRQAGLRLARLFNEANDRAVGRLLGEPTLRNYRLARDVFGTTALLAPPGESATQQLIQPTLSRRILGGAGAGVGASLGTSLGGPVGGAMGAGAGGAMGYGLANLAGRYEPSMLAALNRRGAGSMSEAAGDVVGQLLGGRRLRAPALPDLPRVSDADVLSLPDDGPNLAGRMRRIPAAVRISPEVFDRNVAPSIEGARGAAVDLGVHDASDTIDRFQHPERQSLPAAPGSAIPDQIDPGLDDVFGADEDSEMPMLLDPGLGAVFGDEDDLPPIRKRQ